VKTEVDIEFMEGIQGVKKEVEIEKRVKCSDCKGSRAERGTSPSVCSECGGRGYSLSDMGVKTLCKKCLGAGGFVRYPC
jgi:molecular chaperone DnaJ